MAMWLFWYETMFFSSLFDSLAPNIKSLTSPAFVSNRLGTSDEDCTVEEKEEEDVACHHIGKIK